MLGGDSSQPPLERAAETVGKGTTDAFVLLGNETRLAILLALWEEVDPNRPYSELQETRLRFSELRDRVGMIDSGQFNYHLSKLEGQFVDQTEDGYTLSHSATQILRAILAGTLNDEPSFEEESIETDCRFCGSSTVIDYRDGTLAIRCTNCEGAVESSTGGTLAEVLQPPVGFLNRTPQEFFRHALGYQRHRMFSMMEGTCMDCSGAVSPSIYICSNHDTEGGEICSQCDRHSRIEWGFICEVCKAHHRVEGFAPILVETEVVTFFYERGVDLLALDYWWNSFFDAIEKTEVISDDPLRVRVTVQIDDDQLVVTLDEDANVTEVAESTD